MAVVLRDFGVGEPMTVANFQRQYVPCIPIRTVLTHWEAGRKTPQQMLTYCGKEAVRAGARRGAAKGLLSGFMGVRT